MGKLAEHKAGDSLTLVARVKNGKVVISDSEKLAESLSETNYSINTVGQLEYTLGGQPELIALADQISIADNSVLEFDDDVEFGFNDVVEPKPAVDSTPEVKFSCRFEVKQTEAAKTHLDNLKKEKIAVEKYQTFVAEKQNELVVLAAVANESDEAKNHSAYQLVADKNKLCFIYEDNGTENVLETEYTIDADGSIIDKSKNLVLPVESNLYAINPITGEVAVNSNQFDIRFENGTVNLSLGSIPNDLTKEPEGVDPALLEAWVAQKPRASGNDELETEINNCRNALLHAHKALDDAKLEGFRKNIYDAISRIVTQSVDPALNSAIELADKKTGGKFGTYEYTEQATYLKTNITQSRNELLRDAQKISTYLAEAKYIEVERNITDQGANTTESETMAALLKLRETSLKDLKNSADLANTNLETLINNPNLQKKFPTLTQEIETYCDVFNEVRKNITEFVTGRLNINLDHTFEVNGVENIPSLAKQVAENERVRVAKQTQDKEGKVVGIPTGAVKFMLKNNIGFYGKESKISSEHPFGAKNKDFNVTQQLAFLDNLIAQLETIKAPESQFETKRFLGSGAEREYQTNPNRDLYDKDVAALVHKLVTLREQVNNEFFDNSFDFMSQVKNIVSEHFSHGVAYSRFNGESARLKDLEEEFDGSKESFLLRAAKVVHGVMTSSDVYKLLDTKHQLKSLGDTTTGNADPNAVCPPYDTVDAEGSAFYQGKHPKSLFVEKLCNAFPQFLDRRLGANRFKELPETRAMAVAP